MSTVRSRTLARLVTQERIPLDGLLGCEIHATVYVTVAEFM